MYPCCGVSPPSILYSGKKSLSFAVVSCSVVSDCLWPYELHCVRLSCPPLSPGICSYSCPLRRWCHPTISSSVILFSSCLQSFPASGSFPISWLFISGGQSIGASASASVLTMNIQGWFPLGLTDLIFLLFKGLRFFLVLMTLTVMSNAFVRYFVECPSVKIIPELSPPIRKGQNLLIFDSPNATTSSRRIQYFNFFFFFFFLREIPSFGHLLGSLPRQLDGKGTSVYRAPHLCSSERASMRLTSSSMPQMSPWGCPGLWFPLLLLRSSSKSIS